MGGEATAKGKNGQIFFWENLDVFKKKTVRVYFSIYIVTPENLWSIACSFLLLKLNWSVLGVVWKLHKFSLGVLCNFLLKF